MVDRLAAKLSPPKLGILGVAVAVFFWVALILLRRFVFNLHLTPASVIAEFVLVCTGAILFWYWILSTLGRQSAEIRRQNERLEALHMASIALTTEHELRPVLQKVVDLSRQLMHAKYGALGILDEDGAQIDQFITSGISTSAQARIGHFPRGDGLLGVSLFGGESVRVSEISTDARGAGLPAHHPDMHSFLSVPITSKGRVFGNLYLANKQPAADELGDVSSYQYIEFSQNDQELLEMFAAQAAIAIEDAQLYRANRQIAVLRERERIGMDLHDGVIQSIYAIGLMLDDSAHRLPDDPELAGERIRGAITGLNTVIKSIRNYIHDLQSPDFSDKGVVSGLEELIREFEAYSVLEVTTHVDENAAKSLTKAQASELLHIVQEALTNIRRHAQASTVHIAIQKTEHSLVLSIEDDGTGFDSDIAVEHSSGHGLRNMTGRALKAHGALSLESRPGSGTRITVTIPLATQAPLD